MPKRYMPKNAMRRVSSLKRRKTTRRSVKRVPTRKAAVQNSFIGGTRGRILDANPDPALNTVLGYSYNGSVVDGTWANRQTFALNGMQDTDVTGGAGQPSGYDELAAMYYMYCVYGCAWTLEVYNTTSNAEVVVAIQSAAAAAYAADDTAWQHPYTQSVMLPAIVDVQPSEVKKLSGYVDMPGLFGIPKSAIYTDDRYTANNTGNPATLGHLRIYVQNHDGSSAVAVKYRITLKYYCRWSQPILATAS